MEQRGTVGRGVGIGALLTLGGIVASGVLMVVYIGFAMLFGIGVAQLMWIIPAYLRYKKRGETETAKGILIAAGLVFLLNASCWGVLATSKMDFR